MGKKIKKHNGSREVEIHSINGSYKMRNERYILETGKGTNYLALQGKVSRGVIYSEKLEKFIEDWSQEMSYEKLSKLIEEVSGNRHLTSGGIKSYLERKAVKVSEEWVEGSVYRGEVLSVKEEIKIYEKEEKEIIVFMDDVGVKAQKPKKGVERKEGDAKRIENTVAMVQDSNGYYHYITEGINKKGETIYPISMGIGDTVKRLYKKEKELPIVAITDGARNIRVVLQSVFGVLVFVILDWYHLQHKIQNIMSMMVWSKKDKELHYNTICNLLWYGKVEEAIEYIRSMAGIKNIPKQQELLGYLEKHKHEIIDYQRRQEAGKTIGSGRGEKANDQVVARRQKKKGMSWAKSGSKSLAILKVYSLQKQQKQTA